MLGLRDLRAFPGALKSQFTLALALVQVTKIGLFGCALEGGPCSILWRDLRAIHR